MTHLEKLEKAIAAVRVAAQEIVKLNESPSTRWISVSVDERGAELPGIYITASTSPTPKPRKIDEERIVIYELWEFFPDATEKDYQSDHWTISVEDFPEDWEGGLSELFSVEFQGGETPIRMYNGFEELVEKLAKTPMRESSGLVKASAEPRAILQAISERHGWTISHTVNVTAERMGVSRSTLWEWKWGKNPLFLKTNSRSTIVNLSRARRWRFEAKTQKPACMRGRSFKPVSSRSW